MVDKKVTLEGKTFNLTKRHPQDAGKALADTSLLEVETRNENGALIKKWATINKKYRALLVEMEAISV